MTGKVHYHLTTYSEYLDDGGGTCHNIYLVDSTTQEVCYEQICLDELPECCETISARESKPDNDQINNESKSEAHLKAYPNPAYDNTTIEYGLRESSNGMIYVHDIFSKEVKIIRLNSNSGKLNFNTSKLKNGMYVVSLYSGNERLSTIKLIVLQ